MKTSTRRHQCDACVWTFSSIHCCVIMVLSDHQPLEAIPNNIIMPLAWTSLEQQRILKDSTRLLELVLPLVSLCRGEADLLVTAKYGYFCNLLPLVPVVVSLHTVLPS